MHSVDENQKKIEKEKEFGGDKTKKKKREKGRETERKKGEETSRERKKKKGLPPFLYDLCGSGRRFSLERELKSIHATRAMRGYQNLRVSSNSKG